MRLKNRVVLVTGGAKRVGKEIALTLAGKEARVAITYRESSKEAKRTISQLRGKGVRAEAFCVDTSLEDDVQKTIDNVVKEFGRIDVLVNNAANFLRVPFEKLTGDDFDAAVNVNLRGPYLFSIGVGRLMLKRKSGKIVNIADWAGVRPYNDYLPYCVSKGGVITLTKALAKELAPHVQVNAIMPGPVLLPPDFSSTDRETIIKGTLLKRMGSPRDIAETVRFLVEGSDFITGAIIPVDGGRLIA